jgi:hypothetical protein
VPHWSHCRKITRSIPFRTVSVLSFRRFPLFLSFIRVDLSRLRYANRERYPQRGQCEVGAWPSYSKANRTPTRGSSFDCSLGVGPNNDGT